MAMDYQALLDRRAQIGDEISQTIGRLGVLMRQEVELQDLLRRTAEAAGVKANAFATPTTVPDAICAELTRAGLNPHRVDQRIRLSELIDGQHVRYRAQREVREQVSSPSAA